jgi:hypothetical protein
MTRYFLKAPFVDKWTCVTKEEFMKAERRAGFRPKGGGDGLTTAGFSSGEGIEGKIDYLQANYADKPQCHGCPHFTAGWFCGVYPEPCPYGKNWFDSDD